METPINIAGAREMKVTDLVMDPEVNVRINQINHVRVLEYSQCPNQLPPVSVWIVVENEGAPDEVTKMVLVDGIHRTMARIKAGKDTVIYQVVGAGTMNEAKDFADKANIAHGLNLTIEQKALIARRLQARHDWSARKIGDFLHVHHTTILYWFDIEKKAAAGKPTTPKESTPIKGMLMVTTISFKRWRNKHAKGDKIHEYPDERLEGIIHQLKEIADFRDLCIAELTSRRVQGRQGQGASAPKGSTEILTKASR